ncbi:sulfur carrier protein ThiS [Marinobacter confluentis]|uniref:Sulfur carrier protein ThiS n=1 Tax=Marinobacter confluentis TaxID=1697557 RepID=A0A4Z1BYY1_9GAMM|nr:sulfur carrier protein ThiS [Marinobacter confluentis]TGN38693.1 sulfur carrier protein ThiS [Marinobacter confluentis]
MQIQVNGESMEFGEGATISDLIQRMALEGKRLAVEVNEDIVPRSEHPSFSLSDGDRVEVVHAIGGG